MRAEERVVRGNVIFVIQAEVEDIANESRGVKTILAAGFGGHSAPQRSEPFSACCLQQAHQPHVAKAKKEKEQERDSPPHVQAGRVSNCQHEVDSEAELKQRQQAALAPVFLSFPGCV